ncbi:MAG: substrate-binding domain-containing protein [Victivallis sp.]
MPDKVSVIGEGHRTFCRYVHPRLTVIDCDFMAMSKLAVEIAAGRETPDERRISFPHHVIGRENVKDLTPKP